MVGTQALYLFMRLHNILVQRLCVAKRLAIEASKSAFENHQQIGGNESNFVPQTAADIYNAYLAMLCESMLIDSSAASGPVGGGMNAAANLAARNEERYLASERSDERHRRLPSSHKERKLRTPVGATRIYLASSAKRNFSILVASLLASLLAFVVRSSLSSFAPRFCRSLLASVVSSSLPSLAFYR